jgi:hypothetical protein
MSSRYVYFREAVFVHPPSTTEVSLATFGRGFGRSDRYVGLMNPPKWIDTKRECGSATASTLFIGPR